MYNPQLQSQGGMAVAPPSPSATTAVSNVLSGALDVATDVMQGQAEQKATEQTALDDMMVADTAANLAGMYTDMSGQPVKRDTLMRQEIRALRGTLSPQQFAAVAAQYEKFTGKDLYTSAGQTTKERNELEKQQQELRDRQMQNIEYAIQYREGDAELQKMLTPEGNIADGYTAEDVANRGDLVRSQQQARLVIAQQKRDMAKSAAEKAKAESEIIAIEYGPKMQSDLNAFVAELEGKSTVEGLNDLTQFYNQSVRAINGMPITEGAKENMRKALTSTYESYKLTLSGEFEVINAELVARLSRQSNLLLALEGNPALNVVMSLNDAGVRSSDSNVALAEKEFIDFYKELGTANPNTPPPAGQEEVQLPDGKTIKWDRVMREGYKRDISIKRPIQSDDEIKTYRNIFATVLNPVTGEQRNKFFGPNGGYLSTLSVFQDAEIVERYTPAVLNAEEVREGFINANNTAATRYVQGHFGSDSMFAERTADVTTVKVQDGRVVLGIKRDAPIDAGGIPALNELRYNRSGLQSPRDAALSAYQSQVDKMNRLFRMQYEAAYNYGMTVGGKEEAERMANDVVAMQMNAILQYVPVEEEQDVISRLTE